MYDFVVEIVLGRHGDGGGGGGVGVCVGGRYFGLRILVSTQNIISVSKRN